MSSNTYEIENRPVLNEPALNIRMEVSDYGKGKNHSEG